MLRHALLVLVAGVVVASARRDKFKELDLWLQDLYHNNETFRHQAEEHMVNYQRMMASDRERRASAHPFVCADGYQRSGTPPSSVHQLRPEDIDVVAALGDSLTAGMGVLANSIFLALREYRGRSWSIGGDANDLQGVMTLPNFLKRYNPNIKGYSTGYCDENQACSNLNVAVSGAKAIDMPQQARNLVAKMMSDPNIDVANDWKLVTMFIGGNDLCDVCTDPITHSPANYIRHIREALEELRKVPRMFVNLVEIFDLTPLAAVGNANIMCALVTSFVCGCGKSTNPDDKAAVTQAARDYQAETRNLVASGRYDLTDDFTVVVQSFFRDTEPPKTADNKYDQTYFGPDCFHFSEKGQNEAGKGLWNNMFQSVRSKSTEWFLDQGFVCPGVGGSSPYLRTFLN